MTEIHYSKDWEVYQESLRETLRRAKAPGDAEVIKPGAGGAPLELKVWSVKEPAIGEVVGLAELEMDAEHTFPPHVHFKSVELMLGIEGIPKIRVADIVTKKGKVEIVGTIETITLGPGTIIVIRPGQAQEILLPPRGTAKIKTLMLPPYDPTDEHHIDFF